MQKNSFSKLKIRYLILLLLSIPFAVHFWYALLIDIFDLGIPYEDPITDYIAYSICCLIICWFLLRKLRYLNINPEAIVGKLSINYRRSAKLFLLVTIDICFSIGIFILSFKLISLTAPSSVQSFLTYIDSQDSQASVAPIFSNLLEIFAVVVVAPLAEEFIFRGVLLHILADRWSISLSILFSSLIFGCLHLNPIGASIGGIIYSLLYTKSRSLCVPIVAHAMNNALAIVIPLFLAKMIDSYDDISTVDIVNNGWQTGLILVLISAPPIVHFIYRQYPSRNSLLPYFANSIDQLDTQFQTDRSSNHL